MQKGVTLKDIAIRCGVDVSTVSRALRGSSVHSEKTIQHIRLIAAEMGYDPTRFQAARRLVLSRFGKEVTNRLFAIFLPPYFYYSYYGVMLFQGVLDVLTPAGFGLLTTETSQSVVKGKLPPSFVRGDVDGAIVIEDPVLFQPALDQLRAMPAFGDRPVLFVLRDVPGCSSVDIDAEDAAYELAAYMLSQGHRHMLHFTRQDGKLLGSHQDFFVGGYQRACRDYGLDPDVHLHSFPLSTSFLNQLFMVKQFQHLGELLQKKWPPYHPLVRELRDHPEITAILAPNDLTAIVVRNILNCGGIRIPEDISLTGFDDIDFMTGTFEPNSLTTMHLPLRKMGRMAAKLLIDLVNEQHDEPQRVLVETSLVVRDTTRSV